MSAAFRRPKLTHMPHQVFAREERAAQRLEEIAQHDEHFCGHCGVAGASRGFKRSGWRMSGTTRFGLASTLSA